MIIKALSRCRGLIDKLNKIELHAKVMHYVQRTFSPATSTRSRTRSCCLNLAAQNKLDCKDPGLPRPWH